MEAIKTEMAPLPVGPYSQAVRWGNFLFVSGQIGIDPMSGKLVEPFEEQVRQALKNIEAILVASGSSIQKVVKATLYVTDMGKFGQINEIYREFFGKNQILPARETVQVSALPMGALFEISVIAVI